MTNSGTIAQSTSGDISFLYLLECPTDKKARPVRYEVFVPVYKSGRMRPSMTGPIELPFSRYRVHCGDVRYLAF